MVSAETFVITNAGHVKRLASILGQLALGAGRAWRVTVQRVEPGARTEQEAVLRGMEGKVAAHTGATPDQVHEHMLELHYGTEQVLIAGGTVTRAARRTRTGPNPLSDREMAEHLMFVEAHAAAEYGLEVGR